ncbi:MAG: hypothetical protein ABH822_00835 [Patescibacteria group bacterium]
MIKVTKNNLIWVLIGIVIAIAVIALATGVVFPNTQPQAAGEDVGIGDCNRINQINASDETRRLMCNNIANCFWRPGPPSLCLENLAGEFSALSIDLVRQADGNYKVQEIRPIISRYPVKPAFDEGNILAIRTADGDFFQTFSSVDMLMGDDFTGESPKSDNREVIRESMTIEVGVGDQPLGTPDNYKVVVKSCDSYDDNPDNDCSKEFSDFSNEDEFEWICNVAEGNHPNGSCCQCNNGRGVDVTAIVKSQCVDSNLLYCMFSYGVEAFAEYGGDCQSGCNKITTVQYSCRTNDISTKQFINNGKDGVGILYCFGGRINVISATFGGPEIK